MTNAPCWQRLALYGLVCLTILYGLAMIALPTALIWYLVTH